MNDTKTMKIIRDFYNKLPKFPDGRINYADSDIAPVVTIIVKYKDEILLLKRSNNVSTYRGKWQVVAGYLDEVRPLKEKVLEELKEEVSITKKQIKKIKYGDYFESIDKKIGKTWLVNPVLAELKEKPEIKLNREHTKFKWIEPEEIEKFDIVPNLKESMKRVLG
ncbi:NUDIX domain-containing protein [Candidatus Woesearchaeota archaeon]|nr:NUDIX domain-containing protein [Candidatus Woesearchaeota archaeon]